MLFVHLGTIYKPGPDPFFFLYVVLVIVSAQVLLRKDARVDIPTLLLLRSCMKLRILQDVLLDAVILLISSYDRVCHSGEWPNLVIV